MMNLYPLVNRGRKFFKITGKQKRFILEAYILTGITRFCILFVTFSKLAKVYGKYNEESEDRLCDKQISIVNNVGYVVNLVSKHTPWKSMCLVKALTAQIMLKRRKCPSTIYLGVMKDVSKGLVAHAWLRSGENIITGEDECHKFTQVARFANHTKEVKK